MVDDPELEKARSAQRQILEMTQSWPEVNGVGLQRLGQTFAVKVNLRRALDSPTRLPDEIQGVPVFSRVVGEIIAH